MAEGGKPWGVNGEGGIDEPTDGKVMLSDDMLYKLSKKIAQLTKVIYSLNTRNDDLELDMNLLKVGYEDKLMKAHSEYNDIRETVQHYQNKLAKDMGDEEKKKDFQEIELKKELRKAKHQLKQYETKIKSIEEEQKNLIGSPRDKSDLRGQLDLLNRQLEKERVEHRRRTDNLETQLDTSHSETQALQREIEELKKAKETLEEELNRSKQQEKADQGSGGEEEKKELTDKLHSLETENASFKTQNETLRAELDMILKSQLEKTSKHEKSIEQLDEDRSKLQSQLDAVKIEKANVEQSLQDAREYYEKEVKTLAEEKTVFQENYDQMKSHYEEEIKHYQGLAGKREEELGELKAEVMKIKEDLISQEPKHREAIEELADRLRLNEAECRRFEGELAISQLAAQTAEEQVTALTEQLESQLETAREKDKELTQSRERLSQVQREMGQANEKFACLDEKFKVVENERDTLRKKMKETEIKIEMLNKKQKDDKNKDQHVKDLEAALEEALVEREQILEACEKEIEQERNIAIELEQKMMEDFEWKLREVEAGYKQKIKTLEESIDTRLREQEREILRQKDAELTRMCIDARRDMEDKLRKERESMRSTMETNSKRDKEAAVNQLTLQKDREIRMLQRSWDEEKGRIERETKRLQSQIDQEVAMQVSRHRGESDQKIFDLGRKHAQVIEKYQEEYDRMKEDMEGKLNRLRAENTEKSEEYEQKISDLLSGKVDTIFQMKEEVEAEFSDKMAGLRDIYRTEITQQQDLYNRDLEKWKDMERCLNIKLDEKKQECEDNITYYTQREVELESKIDELMTRLQEQTAAYMKLQAEFDNYDWWEEDGEEEEGGEEGHPANETEVTKKKSRESLQQRSRPPTRPPTREEVQVFKEAVENGGESSVYASSKEVEDPEVPPRRGERPADEPRSWNETEASSVKRNSTSSGKSNRKSNCAQQ